MKYQFKYSYLLGCSVMCVNGITQNDTTKQVKNITLHVQETTVSQYRPAFKANYTGAHSQVPVNEWGTTITSTIYAGVKLWKGAQVIINPEIAGGHGLSSAFGIASFSNGEAFRVGNPDPTFYVARVFYRQLISLSKDKEWQGDNENKISQFIPKRYIAITIGKVSVADYFDDNTFSHNPRTQFLSWGLMSNGAWDYAANTRGYTPSAIAEYISPKFEIRYAMSMLPTTANGNTMDSRIDKANGNVLEAKYKYKLNGLNGKVSALAFYNTTHMGSYSSINNYRTIIKDFPPYIDSVSYNIDNSGKYGRNKYGIGINVEQYLTNDIGVFARASYNDGKNETWCFTEIDNAFSIGATVAGSKWKRKNDIFGLAYCLSGISKEHRAYLANGGLGFILGDGKINYANEHVIETYYSASLFNGKIIPSLTYQFIANPAYNKDRGPINVFSIRLHFSI